MENQSPIPPPSSAQTGRLFTFRKKAPWQWALAIHLTLFLLCLPPYLLCLVWKTNGLPGLGCAFHDITGVPCPSCGFTRSFLWMGRGEWARAFSNSPFASCLYLVMIIFMAINLAAVLFRIRMTPGTFFHWRKKGWLTFVITITSLLVADWIYRCLHGLGT